jgi:hypothetical protein
MTMRRRITKSYLNFGLEDDTFVEEPTAPETDAVVPETVVTPTPVAAAPEVVITTATAVVPSSTDTPAVDPATAVPAEAGVDAPAADVVAEVPATETPVEPVADVPVEETPIEAIVDAPIEEVVPVDAVADAPVDAPAADVVLDAPVEGVVDAPVDVTPETPVEGVTDTPIVDVPVDTPVDVVTEPVVEVPAEIPATGSASADATAAAASAAAASLANADLAPDTKVIVVVVEPAVPQETQDELYDAGEEVDGEVQAADEFAMEAEEVLQEVEIVCAASDELQSLVEVAEDAAETGGLSDDGVKMLTIATESIYNRFGLKGHNGIPSLESFSGEVGYRRVGATTIAVEDIKEKLQAFGKTIVEGLKKIWEFVKKVFAQVFNATTRLEARAKKIQELAKGFKGNGSAQLDNPGLASRLAVGSAVPTNLAAGLSVLNDFVAEATSSVHSEIMIKLAESIKKMQDKATNSEGFNEYADIVFGEQFNLIKQGMNLKVLSAGNSSRASEAGAPESPEGTTFKASSTFPGNVIIWAHVPDTADALSGLSIGRVQSEAGKEAKTLPNLKGEEIAKIAEQSLRFVQMKNQFDADYKKIEQAFQIVIKSAGAHVTVGNFDKAEKSFSGFVSAFQKSVRAFNQVSMGVHRHAMIEALRTHNAALDYAQLALASATKKGTAQAQLAAPQAA